MDLEAFHSCDRLTTDEAGQNVCPRLLSKSCASYVFPIQTSGQWVCHANCKVNGFGGLSVYVHCVWGNGSPLTFSASSMDVSLSPSSSADLFILSPVNKTTTTSERLSEVA